MSSFAINNVLQSQTHIFHSRLEGISWKSKNMMPNAVVLIWHRCWLLMIHIVLQETPDIKIKGGDIQRIRRPCCWKMMADYQCICEMLSKQLLYPIIKVRRCTILHENEYLQSIHALEIAGLWKYIGISWYHCPVTEQIWISFAVFSSKIQSNDKDDHKTTWYCHIFHMQGLHEGFLLPKFNSCWC